MGNYVYSIHNSQDDKLYNVLGRGQLPTVVFGRVIREHSIPGTQYYFVDGRVKWLDNNKTIGYSYVTPFPYDIEFPNTKWGESCVFTIPENFDFNRMENVEYVKQFCRTAKLLNANTMSPNYIIREGKTVCVKTIESEGSGIIVSKHRYKVPTGDYNQKITHGKVMKEIQSIEEFEDNNINCRNKFTVIPVGRIKYKRTCGEFQFYRYKQSTFHYNVRKIVKMSGSRNVWKLKLA